MRQEESADSLPCALYILRGFTEGCYSLPFSTYLHFTNQRFMLFRLLLDLIPLLKLPGHKAHCCFNFCLYICMFPVFAPHATIHTITYLPMSLLLPLISLSHCLNCHLLLSSTLLPAVYMANMRVCGCKITAIDLAAKEVLAEEVFYLKCHAQIF